MGKGKQRGRWFALAAVSAGLVMMMILPAQAQEGDRIARHFLNNVVQLTATFSNGQSEYGFGFVIGERDDLLYVVTARHVVRNDDDPDVTTQQVQARFETNRGKTYPADVLELKYRDWDIALLEIPRPFASYAWESRCLAATPSYGERVWFIGRNGDWWIPPDLRAGVIALEPLFGEKDFSVQIDSVLPGSSGAPLFSANGIVGMIVSDSAENVVVIKIESIREVIVKRWNYPWGLQAFQAAAPQPDPAPKPAVTPTVQTAAAPTQTPEPTPTNTPQPATAMLTIRSNVHEDQVFVNGVYSGATRLDLELPLGQHVIRVEKAGYLPFEQTIDLQAAHTLRAELEPEPTPTPTAAPTATPTPTPTVKPTATPTPTPLPVGEGPGVGSVWTEPETGMEFVWIEGGCFKMGSPDSEPGRYSDEGPVHEVCLDGFWMGKYEVTQAQWQTIMGSNPSRFTGEKRPVETVSWNDAQEFIKKLNSRAGTTFRLPTEAEWEYAARAGSTAAYSFGNDVSRLGEYAWYSENSGSETHPVGQKKPNAWGLHDMHGNVWEWCADWYASGYYASSPRQNPQGPSGSSDRVLRGGSWYSEPWYVRSANRINYAPSFRSFYVGLRLVRKK